MSASRRRLLRKWTLGSGRTVRPVLISLAVAGAGCSSGDAERLAAFSSASVSPPVFGSARQALIPATGEISGSGIVPASRDSSVVEGEPNQNFGSSPLLRVQGSGRARALIGMDPAAVDGVLQGELVRARLIVPVVETAEDFGVEQEVGAHRLRHGWEESSATWNCAIDGDPGNGVADCSGLSSWLMFGTLQQVPWVDPPTSTALVSGGQAGVLQFDVTRDVACAVAGRANLDGWMIKKAIENQPGVLSLSALESFNGSALLLEWTDGAGVIVDEADCSSESSAGSGTCTPSAPNDQLCDGIDDDCDGLIDEDYASVGTSCGNGVCSASGVTSCVAGVVVDSCLPGAPAPSDESCDGIDQDCDGSADEDFVSVATGCGVGACGAVGATSCVLAQVTDSCSPGLPAPSDESCNGIDDDCDGTIDDDYVVIATSCGVGACGATGTTSCGLGEVLDSCLAGVPAASDASCNGIDDDCDGVADQDYAPVATGCGIGACAAVGVTSCVLGQTLNSCSPGTPALSDESCDGIDEDCSGTADEDYVSLATSCGVGACGATGATSCAAGQTLDSCQPGSPSASDASCDGVDQDCSGAADEDYVSLNTSCGVGACGATGTTSCAAGQTLDSCQPGAPAPGDESCNGVDDDCNGTIDDGYVVLNTSCGVGACSATGLTSCGLGQVNDSCQAGSPAPSDATCDGIDDDCDGVVDEDYAPVCSGTNVLFCVAGALAPSDCSDGDACNGGETCLNATCLPGTPPDPDDANVCTADSCEPAIGVINAPLALGTACDDFFECDGAGSCVSLLPPDPGSVAPAAPAGFVSLLERVRFLFEQGDPPIQTGVAPGTIVARTAAVLRGRVLRRSGLPLRGVTVRVHGHPELGETLTRLDGRFDLVVNGGGALTLDYERAGFTLAQRTLRAPVQDYAFASDVVLVDGDDITTVLAFPSPVAQQHEALPSSDADGERTALVHVNAGTTALLRHANGSSSPLSELELRLTELSIGAMGQNALPAELPAGTGYAYAAELSAAGVAADEQVELSQPVSFLVENFLGLPTGSRLPVGSYNRATASWNGELNGRVIQVLGQTSGFADLDLDGSGLPATPAALNALGISQEEQVMLADRYAAGTSLWRATLSRLAALDIAQPLLVLRGTGAVEASVPRTDLPLDRARPSDGALLELDNQLLGQRVAVSGTPFSLNYRSDRIPGTTSQRSIDIPVTGASVSNTQTGEVVEVLVAGQRHVFELPPQPNQSLSFTWDGLDAEQRPVFGRQPVQVNVGCTYPVRYAQANASPRAFGLAGTGTVASSLTARSPAQYTQVQSYELQLGAPDQTEEGLGGWSLSVHHRYDPSGRVLHRGDGTRRSANSITDTIERFAGVPHTAAATEAGDGMLARNATFNEPRAVAVGPDGAVYVGTRVAVRRIDPVTQLVSTVAGGKLPSTCDPSLIDGAPDNMCLFVRKLDFGPDGALYISDNSTAGGTADRIRRLDLSTGLIRHVAGVVPTAGCANRGDGGPARDAALCTLLSHATAPDGSIYLLDRSAGGGAIRKISPNGIIDTVASGSWFANDDSGDIAVGPDGSLYVTGDRSVRRILPGGEERVFAGTGFAGSTGDGGLATSATFGSAGPWSVTATSDGRVIIGDNGNQLLRIVDQKGIIRRLAGAGTSVFGAVGDGGAALMAGLGNGNQRPTLAPDGSVYLVARANQTIRRIRPTLEGSFAGELLVPSDDGREVYRFDANGRHLETLHALTGGLLYSFSYDAEGRLSQISDGDGNTTLVQRDTAGEPVAIVAPFGQETQLETNAAGQLASITDASGAQTQLSYDAGGLLVSKVDARGGQHGFNFDAAGRLLSASNGGITEVLLTRSGKPPLTTITRQSAQGLQRTYSTELLSTDIERRTSVREDGRSERLDTRRDQLQTLTQFDGTLLTSTPGIDPVWGMAEPLLGSLSERLPSGSTRTVTEARTAVLAAASQPLTLLSAVHSFTINGRTATLTYDDSGRSLMFRSPRNRAITTLLDEQGRITQSSLPGLLPASFGYDASGRLVSFNQGTRSLSQVYDAQGYLSAVSDALLHTETFVHDAHGRLIERERADGSIIGYEYDAAGNLVALTPPGRPALLLTYTAADLLESISAPDVGDGADVTSFVYDDDRRLTQLFRPDGSSLQLGYDSAGRLGTVTLPSGSIGVGYFATTGHVQNINGPAGVNVTFQRDGHLVTNTTLSGSVSGSVAQGYDVSRRLISESVNGTNAIAFGYDDDGLVTSAGGLTLVYDNNLELLSTSTQGSVTDSRGYDGHGELSSYVASFAGTPFFSQTLLRDDAGRLQQKTETQSGVTTTHDYGYDVRGQLLSVSINGTPSRQYTYDANGNRLSRTVAGVLQSASYDAQDRITSHGDETYSYAADGSLQAKTNVVSGQLTSYGYDALGNLRSVQLPDGRLIQYTVDGLGRRVGKQIDGLFVKKWLYGAGPNPIAELNAAGTVVARFVYGGRSQVPEYVVQGGASYRVVVDHLGSVRRMVNVANAADVLLELSYDAFGVASGSGLGNGAFGFAGGLFDVDTGLLRIDGRDYDPRLGRFLTRDSFAWRSGQSNAFLYLGNAPTSSVDRSGPPSAPRPVVVTGSFAEAALLARNLAEPRLAPSTLPAATLLPGLPPARLLR